jgi:MinD superfamily P-loop ATPase
LKRKLCISATKNDLEASVESYCEEKGIELIGKIPYDPSVTRAMMNVLSVVEYPCGEVTSQVIRMWRKIEGLLF